MSAARLPSTLVVLGLLAGLAALTSLYTLRTAGPQQETIKRKTQDLSRLQHLSSQLAGQERSRDLLREKTAGATSDLKLFLAGALNDTPHALKDSGKTDAGEGWAWQTLELSIPSIAYARAAAMLETLSALPAPPRVRELSLAPGSEAGAGRMHVLIDVLTPPSQ